MFNQKDLLKDIQEATQQNKDTISLIEKSGGDDVVVIKLIPNTGDQYYYNGDFILDDSRAVYRSYTLNNSESILFKAGREYEKRIKDSRISDNIQIIDNMQKQLDALAVSSEADSQNSEIRIKHLMKEIQSLKDTVARKESEMSETLNSLNSIRSDYEQLKSEFSDYQSRINSAKLEMFRRGVNVDSDVHGIITPYGRIMED